MSTDDFDDMLRYLFPKIGALTVVSALIGLLGMGTGLTTLGMAGVCAAVGLGSLLVLIMAWAIWTS